MNIKDKVLMLMKEEAYRPLSKQELVQIFEIGKKDKEIFYDVLKEMEEEGLIYKTKKEKYGVPEKMNMYVGRLSVHPRGFGFLDIGVEGERDIFVPANGLNGAMHGDKVIARKVASETAQSRVEGEVIKIIERGTTEVVGRYEGSKNFGFVVSENKRITADVFIPKKDSMDAKTGHIVVCRITKFPQKGRNPEGKIIEILGKEGEKGVDVLSIIKQNGLPEEFPKKVLREAEDISDSIDKNEIEKRLDLRSHNIYTIDGADAKDLDDAISIEKLENGNYKLGVHIADVSHYVREGQPLDKEAIKRGTSVYLVDTVIPMLPPKLSNGVCSLHPDVDRLTLSCIMEISPKGKVLDHQIVESVINSKARLIYEDVSDILENDDKEKAKEFSGVLDELRLSEELARILMERRFSRGAMDFDFPESKIIMDEAGNVVDIKKYDRRIANKIIEEFMLIANETVAEQFHWAQIPFVYRVHENPDPEKMQNLASFISAFGYSLKGEIEDMHPKELQKLLEDIEGTKEELVISTIMLRSLKQARYSPQGTGHFGLAAKYYCHFTSPIRRYPDLQIHRIIKEYLKGKIVEQRLENLKVIVEKAAEQSSIREREADEAQRQIEDLRKAEYMVQHIGEEFEGIISSITSFGMFIELYNTIEGLIRLHDLSDDYYIYDEKNLTLMGEHTKKTFKIGDRVKIKVDNVNLSMREINFTLVEKI
ncbi:ribonuclease R [Acetoanaerobium pronyense]|uniref:Ribonuclease R n=1 Tax=Acetoanaerobium pronyense TaxID=1482736 RepID=A0ABS4KLQ0_9FIRM|nr:ribonuclease R [Acetoanaerobium pronyense]MBP2027544.1 ribonuclease R [Acetoanaerobium pronyense]